MQVVQTIEVKEIKSGNSYKRVSVSKKECKKRVENLIQENNQIYKNAKLRGYSLDWERDRYKEIISEIRRLNGFVGVKLM